MTTDLTTQINSIIEVKNNTLTVNLPKDLKIRVNGNLDLLFSADLDIETAGEINILSKDHDIHIDSLHSIIWLNSQRCKQIRDNVNVIQQDNQKKANNTSCHTSCQHIVELYQIIGELNKRIQYLERYFEGEKKQ